MTYGDTLFSIFLRYNFPRYPAQGSFANARSSDARVETEIYGHCFTQSLTYLTKRAHTQGRNSPLFHWHLQGMQVFHSFFCWMDYSRWRTGLREPQAQKPPEVTGAFAGTPQHTGLRASHPWLQREDGFAL